MKSKFIKLFNYPAAAFCLSVIIICVFSAYKNIETYCFDSEYYWTLSGTFSRNGTFSVLYYPQSFRGYFFPFSLALFRLTDPDAKIGFVLFSSLITSASVSIVLPYIIKKLTGYALTLWQKLLILFPVMFFWSGLVIYPLSDFYAFALMLSACALGMKITDETSRVKTILFAVIMGVMSYGAYNTRTIYLFAVIGLVVLLIFKNIKKGIGFFLGCFFPLALGWMVAAYPQILINNQYNGGWSFAVDTSAIDQNGLFSAQLFAGLICQNYITNIDPSLGPPAIGFVDNVGWNIINATGGWRNGSIADYAALALKYPFEVIGVYVRHLTTYLNPVYGETYVSNIYKSKIFLTIFNYLILLISFAGFRAFRRNNDKKWCHFGVAVWLLPIVLSCLAILPGQPEHRFFFPVYMLIYGGWVYFINKRDTWIYIKENGFKFAFGGIVIFIVLVSFWSVGFSVTNISMPIITIW